MLGYLLPLRSGAIPGRVLDTLPAPGVLVRLMLNYAPTWSEIATGEGESHFPEYPEESLEEWHQRHEL